MNPAYYPISIFKGATYRQRFQLELNDQPLNLTDYTVTATYSPKNGSEVPFECTVLDAATGLFQVKLTDEVTSAFDMKGGSYSIVLVEPGGDELVYAYGPVNIKDL